MASVFSVEGLGKKLEAIGQLADQSGFSRVCAPHAGLSAKYGGELGVLFLSFRPEAPKIIMVISGTHGVEGPAGYDLQLDLLEKKVHEKLPKDVGLVFVVALNPWGWANGRRTDENNVDLNRNGWPALPPDLSPLDYDIGNLIDPARCNEEWYKKLTECLADPIKTTRLRREVFRGQYYDPKGIFYGGVERAWSLSELETFYRNSFADTCQHLAVLDIHTGLGEWGEITLISSAGKDNPELVKRCQSWFGLNVVFPNLGQTDVINAVSSDLPTFLVRCLPEAQVTALAAEIGTYPFADSFRFFVAENFLHRHPRETAYLDQGSPRANCEYVRRGFHKIWYPPLVDNIVGDSWFTATRAGFGPILRTVIRGLAETNC